MALKQPFFVLAAVGGAEEARASGAALALRLGADRVPRNAGTDDIALKIVQHRANASTEKNCQRSQLFRTHLVEYCKLSEDWKTAPNTDEGRRRNVGSPDYNLFQAGLKTIAPDFVISYFRAIYKDKQHMYNPDAQRRCNTVPIQFAAGPFDALTVFCLHSKHEGLLCHELKKWSEQLHGNVFYRAIKVIKNAAPEEEALEYLPKKGAAAGQLGPWRVNLTDVCNEALRASGWIIEPGTPCGPWHSREQVAEFGDRLREMRSRRAAAAAAAQGIDSAGAEK
jgi:hypothetical protein